ncbi:hypothetical protein HXX76_016110 [Chlamydomonas incerta]|uniref:Uncharacterized protein n=1 Tax=Chlamydomonas incerta TaxID=51695 RepID=A0A835VNY2_CHLIN|nr:hypothetical protein HXX76_016110 [Chlamydomonas incerta]|eukprot:KAG2422350.1 hypothetical protein HXX76_016110 [Chlamydomonas incerta]
MQPSGGCSPGSPLPPHQQKRRLRQQPHPPAAVAAAATRRLTALDLSPFHALWPLEAVAFRAHVTALQLCVAAAAGGASGVGGNTSTGGGSDSAQGGASSSTSGSRPSSGGAVRVCAVVTDEAGWVAAREETVGGLEEALGHEGASAPAAIASALQAAAACAGGGGNGSAGGGGTPRLQLQPPGPPPTFHTVVWPHHGGEGRAPAKEAQPPRHHQQGHPHTVQSYPSTTSWLEATGRGLSQLLPHVLGSAAVPAAGLPLAAAATGRGGGGQTTQRGNAASPGSAGDASSMSSSGFWVLPSGCAGWRVRGAGNGSSSVSGGVPSSRMAGCVLLFTPQAAADLLRLAGLDGGGDGTLVPSAEPQSAQQQPQHGAGQQPLLQPALGPAARSLLPMVTVPFYARLAQMARQGAVRLSVAVAPPLPPPLPPLHPPPHQQEEPQRQQSPPQRPRRRRFLLFTSAGDQGAWRMWAAATANRSYDLLVAYYGSQMEVRQGRLYNRHARVSSISSSNNSSAVEALSGSSSSDSPGGGPDAAAATASSDAAIGAGPDFVYRSRGSKHQAVARLHALFPGLLQRYEAVAVWDDDLAAPPEHIDDIFGYFADHLAGPRGSQGDVWVAQPSLRLGSKVDHVLAAHQPHLDTAHTSFVENNACVFRSDALAALLDSGRYSGELLGWGVDYAYLAALQGAVAAEQAGAAAAAAGERRFAVMHRFQVLNPPAEAKPEGVREILKLASQEARQAQWREYAARYGITPRPEVAYACVLSAEGAAALARGLPAAQVYPGYCPEAKAAEG